MSTDRWVRTLAVVMRFLAALSLCRQGWLESPRSSGPCQSVDHGSRSEDDSSDYPGVRRDRERRCREALAIGREARAVHDHLGAEGPGLQQPAE